MVAVFEASHQSKLSLIWTQGKARDQAQPEGRLPVAIHYGRKIELRLTWVESSRHPYLPFRFWQRREDGRVFPTQKGVSVRLGETPQLMEGLSKVREEARANCEQEDRHV